MLVLLLHKSCLCFVFFFFTKYGAECMSSEKEYHEKKMLENKKS